MGVSFLADVSGCHLVILPRRAQSARHRHDAAALFRAAVAQFGLTRHAEDPNATLGPAGGQAGYAPDCKSE